MRPRPYQSVATDATVGCMEGGLDPVVSMPTGTGKSLVEAMAGVARHERTGRRQLYLCHKTELGDQLTRALLACGVNPHMIGREQADRRSDRAAGKPPFVVATVQTLASGRGKGAARYTSFDPAEFSSVFVDEGHHGNANTWRAVVQHFQHNPQVRAAGFSATWIDPKGKGVGLACGYNTVAFKLPLVDAIRAGWCLKPLVWPLQVTGVEWDKLKLNAAGQYQEGELDRILAVEEMFHGVYMTVRERAGRVPTILFGPGVKWVGVAHRVIARYGEHDVRSITGAERDESVRKAVFDDFRAGLYANLVNCGVATEGTDLPTAVCAAVCRPVQSETLAMQIVGRVLRVAPGTIDPAPDAPDREYARLWGDDPEPRLRAIAASDKPYATVCDFTSIGARKLVGVLDLLGTDLPKAVVDYAKRTQEKEADATADLPIDPFKALDRADAEWALIQEEVERRRAIKAERVTYVCSEVDVFDPRAGEVIEAPAGPPEMASEKQVWFMVHNFGWQEQSARACTKKKAHGLITAFKTGKYTPKKTQPAPEEEFADAD